MTKNCTICKFGPDWTMDFQWVRLKCKQTSRDGKKLKALFYFNNDLSDTNVVFKSVENFKTDFPQVIHDCCLWEATE